MALLYTKEQCGTAQLDVAISNLSRWAAAAAAADDDSWLTTVTAHCTASMHRLAMYHRTQNDTSTVVSTSPPTEFNIFIIRRE